MCRAKKGGLYAKGPNGEKRLAGAIECGVQVAKIATGEEEDTAYVSPNRRKSGIAGAKARTDNLTANKRKEIATQAAQARWKGKDEMTHSQTSAPCSELDIIYNAKRDAGLVDVKFLHKNLDEGSPAQIEAELIEIQKAIDEHKYTNLDFGDLRIKKA